MTDVPLPRMIAVVGAHRTGSSCVAGMLHKLGVSMGKRFAPANAKNQTGYYEAVALARFCRRSFRDAVQNIADDEALSWLTEWADTRREAAVVGCKYPHLCLLLPAMKDVWPDLRIIATERPIEDVVGSLRRAHWWNKGRHPERFIEKRDADLAALNIPTLRVPYADVVADPTAVVDAMIAFAEITPTDVQRQAAINHVRPELRHIGKPVEAAETIAASSGFSDPVDVVYPLSKGSVWDDNELRYSLRSLEKYAKNLGRVFVVGHKPAWLTGVVHIAMEDRNRRNKDANIINKVRAAIAAGISERFIFASDDQFLLAETDLLTLPVTYGRNSGGRSRWWNRVKHTMAYLADHNMPQIFYDTHLFQPHYASRFERIASQSPYQRGNGFCINTLVINQYELASTLRVPSGSVRGRLMRGYDNSDIKNNGGLKQSMIRQFPDKSRFEL